MRGTLHVNRLDLALRQPSRPRRSPARVLVAALAVLGLLGAACGDQENQQRQAESSDEGIQLTGRVGRAQLSMSYGDPDFTASDCDVADGYDVDWCLTGRSIDGARVTLVFENPSVLVPGAELSVLRDACVGCDDVEGGVVVDLRVDGVARRADSGIVRVESAGPSRYVATFSLRFDDGGQITGTFNVRPLGALVPADDAPDVGTEAPEAPEGTTDGS